MSNRFDIRMHDALLASRMSADEWARISAFRDLPDFIDGARRHEGAMAPFFAHNLILNKVATEVWRFQMLVFTLYLHTTRDPDDPRTGLTTGNLQKICTQLSLASPGRVFAFLNLMKLGGYLSSARSALDSRVVHLEPTAKFDATVEQWNSNIFAAIDAAAPDSGLCALSASNPGLGQAMRTSGAEGLLNGWLPIDPFPEVFHFASADGGWLMMEHLVLNSLRGSREFEHVPVPLNLRADARRFCGSRTNLQRALESGYSLGLLTVPPRGGAEVHLSSLMVCAFLAFMASFLSNFRDHTLIGLKRLSASEISNP